MNRARDKVHLRNTMLVCQVDYGGEQFESLLRRRPLNVFPCIPCGMPEVDIIGVCAPRGHVALVAPSERIGARSIVPLSGNMPLALEVASKK